MLRKAIGGIVLVLAGMAQADEVVIAAFGDSLVQGYGLPVEEGFVPQLQAWLDARGAEARLINAAVSGDTTAGGLARVDWALTPEVDGLIVALGANDLLRGLDPAAAEANLGGILDAASAAEADVLLIGMEAPGNFGADYKTEFDGIYPRLARTHDVAFLPSFFAGLTEDGRAADLAALRNFFQRDGIHPNAEGVARIVDAVGPGVLSLIDRIEAE